MKNKFIEKINILSVLALRVNTETNYCIFTRISGHVNQFEIEARLSKEFYMEEMKEMAFYYVGEWGDSLEVKFQDWKNYLERLLKTPIKTVYTVDCDVRGLRVKKNFSSEVARKEWCDDWATQFRDEPDFKFSETEQTERIGDSDEF